MFHSSKFSGGPQNAGRVPSATGNRCAQNIAKCPYLVETGFEYQTLHRTNYFDSKINVKVFCA
jgi:hypothetical protein